MQCPRRRVGTRGTGIPGEYFIYLFKNNNNSVFFLDFFLNFFLQRPRRRIRTRGAGIPGGGGAGPVRAGDSTQAEHGQEGRPYSRGGWGHRCGGVLFVWSIDYLN